MHFCTCTDTKCPNNPNNPSAALDSCDRCVLKCLTAGEIPSCFFKAVHPDTSRVTDYSYEGFARYLKEAKGR